MTNAASRLLQMYISSIYLANNSVTVDQWTPVKIIIIRRTSECHPTARQQPIRQSITKSSTRNPYLVTHYALIRWDKACWGRIPSQLKSSPVLPISLCRLYRRSSRQSVKRSCMKAPTSFTFGIYHDDALKISFENVPNLLTCLNLWYYFVV